MVRDIPIRMLDELPEFVKTIRVDIAALLHYQNKMRKLQQNSYLHLVCMLFGILHM